MTADPRPVFTLATGPVGSTPATQAALAQPVLHHTDPAFRALYAETVTLLREAFGTSVDPVVFPGEAVVGIEAAAAALIGPDDVVLNLVSGIYGRAFGQLAARFAREVVEVETGDNASIAPAAVSDALARRAGRHDRRRGALRDPVGHDERPRRHRRARAGSRGAADRRRRVQLRRHADRLRALARHRDHRTAEVPRRHPWSLAAARQRRRLAAHRGQPERAEGIGAVDRGLAGRAPAGPGVPVHAAGLRDLRRCARCCSSTWPKARRTSSHATAGRPAPCGPARRRSA